jgi:hypothetical protein
MLRQQSEELQPWLTIVIMAATLSETTTNPQRDILWRMQIANQHLIIENQYFSNAERHLGNADRIIAFQHYKIGISVMQISILLMKISI